MANELVTWSDELSVGNKTIDEQHQELVRMTNEFYAGCLMGGIMAKVYFLKTIQGAVHYIKTHFSTEEEILKMIEYPELEFHKKQHEDFIATVLEQVRAFETEDNPDPTGFIRFLMDWILKHIANMDKNYIPYLDKLKL
ncbi:MAG: bacteriohemerythrin [Treponema sp.]|nr:bacteriohemerythrin [Treponema sp.]